MVNILEGILLYFYGHLTMGKLNPALLSNNVIENSFFDYNVYLGPRMLLHCHLHFFFNSNSSGYISLEEFSNSLLSFLTIRSSINLNTFPNFLAWWWSIFFTLLIHIDLKWNKNKLAKNGAGSGIPIKFKSQL